MAEAQLRLGYARVRLLPSVKNFNIVHCVNILMQLTELHDMMLAVAKSSTNGDTSDYAAAEQATMAFASIIYTLNAGGDVDAGVYASLKAGLNQCYGAIQKEDSYDPVKFAAAAQAVTRAMP